MVFESVVAELLNKVLGDYVQNLDHKQLKLSLWGGDVVLNDLLIKETALDKLDQPVKLAYGRLGKLRLTIPFKDMWNGQVNAVIEELYLLVVPCSQTQYDAEKEARAALEAKQAEIARIEKSKLQADVKNQEKLDDSMVEKLVARMIKNIHVEVKKIHVRYEDHTTFKDTPFSVGFTLSNFTLESCDESWTTTGNLKDMHAIAQIYKLCTLDGLGVYLNPTFNQISKKPQSEYRDLFSQGIATIDYKPDDYHYLLGPINAMVKLKLNPKPETDGSNYKIPKVWMDAEMQKLKIGLSKIQYQTIMRMGEGLDRAQKAAPYKKYRPHLTSYKGHYKEWWKFAFTCILEETVRRCQRNWDWNHIKQHRDTCRSYGKAYHTKLSQKKIAQDIVDHLAECERVLDIFNLVIIRQQIELEVERLAEKEKNLKAKKGWFGFLWGSGPTEEEQDLNSAAAILRKFEEAMTPQEKEKLYRAIDYQENCDSTHYPETYEDIVCHFFLHGLEVFVLDTDKEFPQVLDLQFNGVQVGFISRPVNSGIRATASINDLKLLGVRQKDTVPTLLTSEGGSSGSVLFAVTYEKNPVDKSCGDRVIIKSTSVQIVYDAHTIIELVKVFKIQDTSTLNQLQAAAATQLEGLKEMSALGLEYAIEKHSVLDIQVDLQASQLIVPRQGFYTGKESLFVLNLGSLRVSSLEKPKDSQATATVKQLVNMGKSEEDILTQLRTYSYDKFVMKIGNFQALVAFPNEDWRSSILTGTVSSMTILKPTTLEVQFDKCLIMDDPLLPKTRIIGNLPSVALNISDARLLEAISIAQSIPLPQNEDVPAPQPLSTKSVSQVSLMKELSAIPMMIEKKQSDAPIKQTTDLEAKFVMKEFVVTLSKQDASSETAQPFLKVEVLKLEAEMVQRSFDQDVKLRLGGVQVTQYHDKGEIFMINTPMASGIEEYLIVVQYVTVNKRSPEFTTVHGSVLQLLQMEFTKLDVLLHQEAIINVLRFASDVQGRISAETQQSVENETAAPTASRFATIHEDTTTQFTTVAKQKLLKPTSARRKKLVVECIDLKIKAKVGSIRIKMANDNREISAFLIEGINAGYIMKASYSQANVNLAAINIADLNPLSAYENIVSVTGSEALEVQAVIYNVEPWEVDKNNMSIKVNMGCHRVVFLNSFVTGVMNFLNHFQAAQEAIKEASAAAAEAAKENIKDVQERATRIELAVKIKAPVVYIPLNSKSDHALMLDMGNLTVSNILKKLEITNDDGNSPVLDEMKIDLQDMKLSRVRLNPNNFIADNEVLLLQPVSFTFLIKRNLSTAWFTSIPDVDMSGRLNKIELLISQEDYGMVMRVLSENLGETGVDPEPDVAQTSKASPVEDWNKHQLVKPDLEVSKQTEAIEPQGSQQIHTVVKFEFIMDSLVINLFTGGSKSLSSTTSPMHLPENGLAKFSLSHFALKGRMFGDGLLATSILLMNCTLDDTRHGREGSLTRIMERINEPVQESHSSPDKEVKSARSMVDMTLRKGVNDTFVDVRVFSFSIIVSLDYLMKVKDFFNVEQPQATQTPPVVAQKGYAPEVSSKKMKSSTTVQPVAATFTINVHIEKPDIILLEDMDNIDSNCIVLNTEVLLKLRLVGEHQIITGSIKDLSILAGIYNPLRRSESIYQVLRPCSISLAGSTPDDKGLHVEIFCTDIHVSVSPGVIEMLNKVVQTVTKNQEVDEDSSKPEPDHSGVWMITPFHENDYWFLRTEAAKEAYEALLCVEDAEPDTTYKQELAIINAPTIVLTLEAGVGNKTLPMLLFYVGFQSNVNDWSTKTMSIESTMTVAMAYYNSRLALWEPLIEPMECTRNGKRISTPWELTTKIQFNDMAIESPTVSAASPSTESEPEIPQSVAKMCIDVSSTENLEITVTKTCLDVLKQLGSAFSSAIEPDKKQTEKVAPYLLKNDTGLSMTLHLEHGHFKVVQDSSVETNSGSGSYTEVLLESGASVYLAPTVVKSAKTHVLEELKAECVKIKSDNTFIISFKGIENKLEIPVLRADKRFFPLKHRSDGSDEWGIISDVVVEDGSTILTLRSVLQVHNHFSEPVSVYYMTKRGNEVECVGTVQSDQCLNLPLDAVYTPTHELFFSVEGYTVSIIPFIWKDLQKTVSMTKLLQCESRSRQEYVEPFYIKAVGEIEQVYFENTSRHTMSSTSYNIHLYPSVYLKNFLPIDIVICLPGVTEEKLVPASKTLQIPTIEPGRSSIVIKLPQYLEKDWSCRLEIQGNPSEFSVCSFESFDSMQKVVMDLGMHTSFKHGSILMALYCPFWMLNKTGLMLSYRKSSKAGVKEQSSPAKNSEENLNVLYHPESYKGVIMFSFNKKAFFGKKKAMIRVEDGEWSDKFSIDVAGSKGVVSCKYDGIIHQIGVHNQLTYNSLTKQITFTPYFVLINNSDFLIECQESERPADPLFKISPGECSAFWPRSEKEVKTLKAKVAGHPEKTAAFICTDVHTTLLKLDNKYGGINVDVQINEGGVYISMSGYTPGNAPALIINHTSHTINLWEKGSMNVRSIQSFNRMFYTWENPAGSRTLVWEDGNKKEIENDLRKDNLAPFVLPDVEAEIFYVSFLNGIQRVLLFTSNLIIAEHCQLLGAFEAIDQEITLSIHGVGVSLVNNISRKELLYMCIASSGVIWESRKSATSRWRALNTKDVITIEQGYQHYMQELQTGRDPPYQIMLEPKLEVDYLNSQMMKPHRRHIRRTFQTGLWVQHRSSAHEVHLHAKVNRLQIDNQLSDCIFPVILGPVPPPKSIAQSSVMKPFAEMSMVKRLLEHSTVQQFKYFKVLIQEFHIKVDLGFIGALTDLFKDNETSDAEESELFAQDMKLVKEPLMYHVTQITTAEQKNFFDLLHFSPLKIHISFSMAGGGSAQLPEVLNVLLQGIGVTLTDINDIVFKLAYFERDYTFMTHNQLMSEATSHYVGQAIKQAYVLVLGLDVIGNPYGLVVGTMKGIEDLFYEPFQGAIEGPGEFAEGLLLGVRSMFGHTVGGMAGAVSKITGAMGKGIAALTFDKDYQRKRQEQLKKQPANLQEGLARSGKGLVMGVVDGVTGVVMNPISGAKEDGVEGFFKGFGRGVVGLVARPATGIIDFASGSLGAVKRATEMSEEVKRVRPPRFLQPDSLVRPYIRHEADGNKILLELEKGKYANTDIYVFHLSVDKDFVLLTNKRIAFLVHSDLFGGWQVEWSYTWQEVSDTPKVVKRGVEIPVKEAQKKKKLSNFFSSTDHGKIILISDEEIKKLLCSKIEEQISQSSA